MNILVIANQFPPMGGSGVQRTSKFVKYLPMFGYFPIVLTRDDKNMALKDESLLLDIPEDTPVVRTKAYDVSNLKGVMRLPGKAIGKYALIPDGDIVWAVKSFKEALSLINKHNIKIIYSTSYPYSDHLLALKIKRAVPSLKWAADFRDEWTNNPYILDNPHGRLRSNIERKMEKAVLTEAEALISNTPVMVDNFIRLNGLKRDNFYCIPNGYDEDDFRDIEDSGDTPIEAQVLIDAPVESPRKEKFLITYTGALYGRRKPDTFFTALKQLIDEKKIDEKEISVSLIGNYIEKRLNVSSYGLSDIVKILPYMPHKECLKRLYSSDCLLLIEGQGPGAEAFYTGKIFEYMKAKAPVLAVIPKNGAAAGLIRQTGIGRVCEFSDVADIKEGLMFFYTGWKNGESRYSPDYVKIARYERKELTRKLAGVFDTFRD